MTRFPQLASKSYSQVPMGPVGPSTQARKTQLFATIAGVSDIVNGKGRRKVQKKSSRLSMSLGIVNCLSRLLEKRYQMYMVSNIWSSDLIRCLKYGCNLVASESCSHLTRLTTFRLEGYSSLTARSCTLAPTTAKYGLAPHVVC